MGVTSRIAVIAIDAVQPRIVANFWRAALGWEEIETDDDVISIAPTAATWPTIDIAAVAETKNTKNRLHLDVRADECSSAEELQRLLDLGAQRVDVGQSTDVSWIVLADPEGNEFCLLPCAVQEVIR